MRLGLRLADAPTFRGLAAGRDFAIDLARKRDHVLRLDIAGNDEDRIFRRIEALVIGQRIVAAEAGNIVGPADDRQTIGMAGEQRRLHRLVQEMRAGVGIGAHAAFFEHDIALGGDDLVGQHEILHAVGFVFHAGARCSFGMRWK